jgi:hypothetical protein
MYVSGFDPKGAAHYHALYRDEAARKDTADSPTPRVSERQRRPDGNSFWDVQAQESGQVVHTHYEFMRWDDIVRRHWPRTTWALWRAVISTTTFYVRHGTLWKMFLLSWPPVVAAFTPFLLVCALLLGVPLAVLAATWCALGLQWHPAWALVTGAGAGAAVWGLLRMVEKRFNMYWMMRSYAFTARQARGELPDLDQRLDMLARRLVERMETQRDDEILVVGHSSGAIMAAIIVARALQQAPELLSGRTRLSLLTLGQWIPLLGLLPMAQGFRAELHTLGGANGLTWVDFSAPPDGCCFALSHPLRGCGVSCSTAQGADIKLLNPRFANLFHVPTYAALKRDKFAMHFQYLRRADKAGDYDYFAITSGAQTLAERYAQSHSVENYAGLKPLA